MKTSLVRYVVRGLGGRLPIGGVPTVIGGGLTLEATLKLVFNADTTPGSTDFNSLALVDFDTEEHDNSWNHDIGTDGGLVTVPSGITKVGLSYYARQDSDNATDASRIEVRVNGSAVQRADRVNLQVPNTTHMFLDVEAGDTIGVYHASNNSADFLSLEAQLSLAGYSES